MVLFVVATLLLGRRYTMESYMAYICLLFFASTSRAALPTPDKYRDDYEYNAKTDAFYKLHIDLAWQDFARGMCEAEGAVLLTPSSPEDLEQVREMMRKFPDYEFVRVDDDGQPHEPADAPAIIDLSLRKPDGTTPADVDNCDVVTKHGEVRSHMCTRLLPYVCKVKASDAPYDEKCGVYGSDYHYLESVGSCYELSSYMFVWEAAYDECKSEGAHLVIFNSEAEYEAVRTFMRAKLEKQHLRTHSISAGFRAREPTDGSAPVFLTIFNQTLDEAGYNTWTKGQPSNNAEYCGAIAARDGKYNDIRCFDKFLAMCEVEVKS